MALRLTDRDLKDYPALAAAVAKAQGTESPQTPPAAPVAAPTPVEAVAVQPTVETPPQAIVEGPFHATLGPRQRRPRANPLGAALDWLAPPVDAPAAPTPRRWLPWAGAATIALGAVLAGGLLMAHPGTAAAPSGYACMVEGVTVRASSQAACEAAQAKAAARQAAQVPPATTVPTVATVPAAPTAPTTASTNPPAQQPAPTVAAAPNPQPVATQPTTTPPATPPAPTTAAAPPPTVVATTPAPTVSFGPAMFCQTTWYGARKCQQVPVNGQMGSGQSAAVRAAVCQEENRSGC